MKNWLATGTLHCAPKRAKRLLSFFALSSLALSGCGGRIAPTPGDTDGSDTDTDTDSDSDTDTDTDTDTDADADCGAPPNLGSFYGGIDASKVTTASYLNDAGIAAAIAAGPGDGQGPLDLSANPMSISSATVTVVGFPEDKSFWIEDSGGAMQAYFDEAPLLQAAVPGDVVSFEITEMDNFGNRIEISKYANYVVERQGDPVRVQPGAGIVFNYDIQGGQVFDIYGELVTDVGECGPANCWLISNGGVLTEVRLGSAGGTWVLGDCIHFVAPVTRFDTDVQFDMFNFDWFEYY
mgnify:CR=1 FL=1